MNGPMATCALRSSIPHFVQQMGYMRAISRPGARAWCGCPEARKKIGNCDPRHSPNGAGSSRVCLPDRSAPRIPSMSGPEGPGFETGARYFCGRGERMTVRLSCSQGRSADNAAQLYVKMLLPLWVAIPAARSNGPVAEWLSDWTGHRPSILVRFQAGPPKPSLACRGNANCGPHLTSPSGAETDQW